MTADGMYLKKGKEERLKLLQSKCDQVLEFPYQKKFTEKEMNEILKMLGDKMVELHDLEDRLEELKAEFREEMSPLKTDIGVYTGFAKYKSRLVKEPCYKFIDRETKIVKIYNEDGHCVEDRPATDEEMQLRIKMDD
jgi:hypothetical protein